MSDTAQKTGPVTYADGSTSVLPGDRVSLKLFLRRSNGEVIYVPGISKRRGTYEHHGLTWVGVSLADGWAVSTIVLPETGRLKAGVRFLGRGTESAESAEATKRIEQLEDEEDRAIEEEAPAAAGPAPKAKAVDWLAGAVAVVLQLGLMMLIVVAFAGAVLLLRRLLF